jgi:plastocyanin
MSTPSRGAQGSVVVGAVVAILIVGAVATLGYYQFEVAKSTSATTTTSTPLVSCPSLACANVTIFSGAQKEPTNYTSGELFGYSPATVVVVIGKNNTVFWTNDDSAPHTVTSDTAGMFDSGTSGPLITQGGTYQFTFTTPGTYTYHCTFHNWMHGKVIVEAAPSSSTSTSAQSQSSTTST